MCGISGFFGDFDPGLLEEMNLVQSHRGPDDEGTFYDSQAGVGLAHRRLAILDLSERGHQPMWDITHRACIIFNGEIFNFRELREELQADGFRFRSASDTEVLLNLYLRDGEAMLSRLNGQFAFAIWDPARREMFLARDQFGIKPLYYATTRAGFLFASELKALLCEDTLDRDLDLEAIHYHLTYLWSPAPHTMLQAVRKLEPGHAMIVRSGNIERNWRFAAQPFSQGIEPVRAEDAAQKVRSAIRSAVQRQMVADVPVGAFLSGGIDSSAVVAFAREFSASKLQCFTIAFRGGSLRNDGMPDDLPYAQRVARHLDVDLRTVDVGPEMADHFEDMVYRLDEPQADPAALNVLFIGSLARENGIKVLLSGAGGDDVFSGYRRHYALMLEQYWSWLPQPMRRVFAAAARAFPQNASPTRRVSKAFRYARLDAHERMESYFFWADPEMVESLYGPAMKHAKVEPPTPLLKFLKELGSDVPPLNRMLALEQRFFLPDHNLHYTDKMCMASGVEARVPLLDPEVVALATCLPIEHKQRGGQGKWILRKAMEPYLPDDVIYRSKTGFGVPVRRWLRNELRPLVDEVLSSSSLRERGLFDPTAVQRLIANDTAGRIDGAYTILSLLCIELWCRRFLSAPREKSPGVNTKDTKVNEGHEVLRDL